MQPPTSVEDIWARRSAPGAFPMALARDAKSAICFFSAAFYGANDVIFLNNAGIKDLTLVDVDEEKLGVMATIYSGSTAIAGDAFEIAREMRAQKRRFDLVVTDPFTNLTLRVVKDEFDTFQHLVNKSWIIGVCGNDLTALGLQPETNIIQRWLDHNGRSRFTVTSLGLRNAATAGGSYWLSLSLKNSMKTEEASHQ